MTTQEKTVRASISKHFLAFIEEVYPLLVEAYDGAENKMKPVMKEIWYYTRWAAIMAFVFVAYDVVAAMQSENGIWELYNASSSPFISSHEDTILVSTVSWCLWISLGWFLPLGVLLSPFIFHYLLIRRPDVGIKFCKGFFK